MIPGKATGNGKTHGEGKPVMCVLMSRFPLEAAETQSRWGNDRVDYAQETSDPRGKEGGLFVLPFLCFFG